MGGAAVQIKWPNDIHVGGRKIAGILVETFNVASGVQAAVIGVGLNVGLQPEHLPDDDPGLATRVTSLSMQGASIDRLLALANVMTALDDALEQTPMETLLQRWRARSTQLHHAIRVRSHGRLVEGEVMDLDPYDGLIVRTLTGEIVHLPAAATTVI